MAAPRARDVARGVLRRVEQGEAYASLALAGALDRSELEGPDRALATELVYGVLRHRQRLDRALASHAPRGIKSLSRPVLVALRVAAYQMLLLRIPAHAAIDDAVNAVRAVAGQRQSGFANALLRKLSTAGEPALPPRGGIAWVEQACSIPAWIARRMASALPAAELADAGDAFTSPAPVVLRVARGTREDAAAAIRAERPQATVETSPLAPAALIVRGASAPEKLGVFGDGSVTVQDLSAQLVGAMVGARAGERVLDACAGVGGKTAQLAAVAEVDAADLSRRKLDLAVDAARRLGVKFRTIETDLLEPRGLAERYDRVVLDAPCSGLGVLRRHPEAKWRTAEKDVTELAALQARLLATMADRVAPGGVLVYSVCTFTDEEGPAQIARFLAARTDFRRERPEGEGVPWADVLDADGQLRTWPHRHGGDAFFAARLRRDA